MMMNGTDIGCDYCGESLLVEDGKHIDWSPVAGVMARIGYPAVACPDCVFENAELKKAKGREVAPA